MVLLNDPGPDPSEVFLLDVVGFSEVFQHTPLTVTSSPPASVTLPPVVAEVFVMLTALAVVTAGGVGFFSHDESDMTVYKLTSITIADDKAGLMSTGH